MMGKNLCMGNGEKCIRSWYFKVTIVLIAFFYFNGLKTVGIKNKFEYSSTTTCSYKFSCAVENVSQDKVGR